MIFDLGIERQEGVNQFGGERFQAEGTARPRLRSCVGHVVLGERGEGRRFWYRGVTGRCCVRGWLPRREALAEPASTPKSKRKPCFTITRARI